MTEARAISDGRQSDLAGLLAKVEAARGADRTLDGWVSRVIDEKSFGFCGDEGWSCGECKTQGCGKPLGLHDERSSYPRDWQDDERLPLYTSSIDAALGLVERLLPEWSHANGNVGEQDIPWACLTEPVEPCRDFAASAVTEPIAILAALLSALTSLQGHHSCKIMK